MSLIPLRTYARIASSWVSMDTIDEILEIIRAGSVQVGDAQYPVPAGAVFVNPTTGSDSAAGTEAAPYATIAKAAQVKSAGGHIVLRGGVYYTELNLMNTGRLYLQSYPGEEVWMDGTSAFTSWTDHGDGSWSTTYTTTFSRFSVTRYPGAELRNYVDQVFNDTDGLTLTQVADGVTSLSPGQFSVNQSTDNLRIRLHDSSSPVGKDIRASTRQTALIMSGAPVEFRGFGIRRYSPASIEGINAAVYFGGNSGGSLLENMVIQESAMAGLNIIKTDVQVYNCTIQDCGQTGFHADSANRIQFRRNHIRRTNRSLWQTEPTTASMKCAKLRDGDFHDNIFEDSWQSKHAWFDVSCLDIRFTNNKIIGPTQYVNSSVGLLVELSDGGFLSGSQKRSVFSGNRFSGLNSGMQVFDSGHLDICNNLFDNCRYGLYIWQDNRFHTSTDSGGGATPTEARWVSEQLIIDNNQWTSPMTALGTPIQLLCYDQAGEAGRTSWYNANYPGGTPGPSSVPNMTGIGMIKHFGANHFAVSSGTMVQLGTTSPDVRTPFNSPTALAGAGSTVGGPWGSKFSECYQGGTVPDSAAVPLSAQVAALLGLPEGSRVMGPPKPAPTPV